MSHVKDVNILSVEGNVTEIGAIGVWFKGFKQVKSCAGETIQNRLEAQLQYAHTSAELRYYSTK